MEIAVITITCNRLDLTKKWLGQLKKYAGLPFKHFIVDNGSTDGTVEWLTNNGYTVFKLKKNYGIINALRIGIREIYKKYEPDFIIKFDNDCEILSDNILKGLMKWYDSGCDNSVIAPLDIMILPEQMPRKMWEGKQRGFNTRQVSHTGGIFQILPKKCAKMLLDCRNNELIGGDLLRGRYWNSKGIDILYITDFKIAHRGIGKQTKNYKLK